MKTNTKRIAVILALTVAVGILLHLLYLRNNIQPEIVRAIFTSDVLDLEELHDLVSQTDGFYARDWSLWLGWNNVRFKAFNSYD